MHNYHPEYPRNMYVLDPLHNIVALMVEPDITERLQLADADLPLALANSSDGIARGGGLPGRILLPGSTAVDGFGSDNGTGSRTNKGAVLTLQVGRVLWAGPGKQVEGAYVPVDVKRGELVLYSPRVVTHSFRLHGRAVAIVPVSECLSRVREVDAAEFARELDASGNPHPDVLAMRRVEAALRNWGEPGVAA